MIEITLEQKINSKKQLNKKGFAILRNSISKELIEKIQLEVLKFSWGNIGNAEVNLIHTKKKSILSSAHNLVSSIEIFNYLYRNRNFLDFYKFALNSEINKNEKINSSYFFKAEESKEIKIHQDNAYFNLLSGIDCLTFYIPVHRQNKKSGTIFYYSGSHSLGQLRHLPEGNLGASMCLDKTLELRKLRNFKIEYINLYPGDLVVHNAYVVHGTLPNPKNVLCEAFNFTLFGKSNKQDLIKYKKYRALLKNYLSDKN